MKPKYRNAAAPMDGTLSIGQLARRWNISPKQIRRLLRQQQLGFEKIIGQIRIPLGEVERYEKALFDR